jgi:tetratricopeptide (TPR) repeat protein
MSVSIPTPAGEKLKSKFQVSPRLIGQLAWIVGAVAIVVYLQLPQLAALKQQRKNLSKAALQQEEARAKTQFSIVKTLPAFGFKNIVADWHFMEFLQYFGDAEVRRQTGYGLALDYFDVILDRDPRFLYAYYYLSNTGSLYAGQPEKSVALMNQGLKSLAPKVPDRSYYIWRLKAVDELLFLGKVADARNSMLTAAQWARHYPDLEAQNAIRASLNTANYLTRNPNSKQAQFDAWNMVLSAAVDESVTKRAIGEIRSLGGKVTIGSTGEFQVEAPISD